MKSFASSWYSGDTIAILMYTGLLLWRTESETLVQLQLSQQAPLFQLKRDDTGNDITIMPNVTGATAVTAAAGDTAKQTAAKVNALTGTTGVIATASKGEYVVKTTETTASMTATITGGVGSASTGVLFPALLGFAVDAINGISGSTSVLPLL